MKITVNGVDVSDKKFGEIKETDSIKIHNINYKIVDVEITDDMNDIEHHRIAEIDLLAIVDDEKLIGIDELISYYSVDDEYMSNIANTIING